MTNANRGSAKKQTQKYNWTAVERSRLSACLKSNKRKTRNLIERAERRYREANLAAVAKSAEVRP